MRDLEHLELHRSIRRGRKPDGNDGSARHASESPSNAARATLPMVDELAAGFDGDTVEYDQVAAPWSAAASRVITEPMPSATLAHVLAASMEGFDGEGTVPVMPRRPRTITTEPIFLRAADRPTPTGVVVDLSARVIAVSFGDDRILIVDRGAEVDLILPGGQRLSAPRSSADALAEALGQLAHRPRTDPP